MMVKSAQTVQGLADYAQKFMPGSIQRFAYFSEGLDGARLLAKIMPNCSHTLRIVHTSVCNICC